MARYVTFRIFCSQHNPSDEMVRKPFVSSLDVGLVLTVHRKCWNSLEYDYMNLNRKFFALFILYIILIWLILNLEELNKKQKRSIWVQFFNHGNLFKQWMVQKPCALSRLKSVNNNMQQKASRPFPLLTIITFNVPHYLLKYSAAMILLLLAFFLNLDFSNFVKLSNNALSASRLRSYWPLGYGKLIILWSARKIWNIVKQWRYLSKGLFYLTRSSQLSGFHLTELTVGERKKNIRTNFYGHIWVRIRTINGLGIGIKKGN